MIKNVVAAWLFAASLVVVAVFAWRAFDTCSSSCDRSARVDAVATTAALPAPAALPGPDLEPKQPRVHTCGGGAGTPDDVAEPTRKDPFQPVALDVARLELGSQPFADATLDGERIGSTPFYGRRALTLSPGQHRLVLWDPSEQRDFAYQLDVGPASNSRVNIVLGRTIQSRGTGTLNVVVEESKATR